MMLKVLPDSKRYRPSYFSSEDESTATMGVNMTELFCPSQLISPVRYSPEKVPANSISVNGSFDLPVAERLTPAAF